MAWEHLRSSYDEVARKYEDRFLDELRGKPRDREILAAFAAAVPDPVVEVGCGPGQIGLFVKQHGRRVYGLDLSSQMARLANVRLDGALAADMHSLPFASEQLGALVAFYSLIHVRRSALRPVLREFHRVSRRWVIIDYRHCYTIRYVLTQTLGRLGIGRTPLSRVSRKELDQEFTDAGFAIRKVIRVSAPLLSDKWIVLAERA